MPLYGQSSGSPPRFIAEVDGFEPPAARNRPKGLAEAPAGFVLLSLLW
jgi:hypothetical protein